MLEEIEAYRAAVARSVRFLYLPPSFGADCGFPMATMFVELAVSQARLDPSPRRLGTYESLAKAIAERHQRRFARRTSAEHALCGPHRRVIVLGEPGSGKTSLLKHAALQIATGEWSGRSLPFFVRARQYIEAQRRWKHTLELTLLRYVLLGSELGTRQAMTSVPDHYSVVAVRDVDYLLAIERFVLSLAVQGKVDVVLLLDGLDEVASEPRAVETITRELLGLHPQLSWVVSSRRAGFFGGLQEDIRYEVVDLHDKAIIQLARNWFRHATEGAPQQRAEALLNQVFANNRLHSMARNPFLLTCLCYIAALDARLPVTRTEVYERIFSVAREHLRLTRRDQTLLSVEAIRHLSRFCHHLYTGARGKPRQIFDIGEWESFPSQSGSSPPELRRHFLDSRLMDCWTSQADYHLVHLTLHEFMVAQEMVNRPLPEILSRCYHPAWREIVRFVGGMLWQQGRTDDLRELLDTILDPPDMLGMVYIEAARVLMETGHTDSTPLLGYDLRERLLTIWTQDIPWLEEAAATALAILDPDGILERAFLWFQGDAPALRKISFPEAFALLRASPSRSVRGPRARIMHLISEIRSEEAAELLWDVWDGDNDALALHAAEALARQNLLNTPARVLSYTDHLRAEDPRLPRVCRFAQHARCRELLPWLLERLSRHEAVEAVLEALQAIASPAAVPAIIAWLDDPHHDPEFDDRAFETLATTPSSQALGWLCSTLEATTFLRTRRLLVWVLAQNNHLSETSLLKYLDEDDEILTHVILEAIADLAEGGLVFSEAIDAKLLNMLDDPAAGEHSFEALSRVVVGRKAARKGPLHIDRIRHVLDHGPEPWRATAASTLGHLGVRSARDRLIEIAQSPSETKGLRMSSISALGAVAGDEVGVEVLVELVGDRDTSIAASAAEALGQADFEELSRLPQNPTVTHFLAQVAAQRGLLLFDRYYIGSNGSLHTLPPSRPLAGDGE